MDFSISFDGEEELVAYSDANYADDPSSSHFTTGLILMRGGPIVWMTQKQRLVATLTAEA